MRATGIVRRIDELGRVVIPKEIRRTLRIRENEPLEIFTEKNGEIIFKKYSPMGELAASSLQCAEAISKSSGCGIVVCDNESIIGTSGVPKKQFSDKLLSDGVLTLLEKRKHYVASGDESIAVTENGNGRVSCFSPVISDGNVIGAVISLSEDTTLTPTDAEKKLVSAGAMFLGKQSEI